ncbi:replication protein RepA [Acidisoma sp. S159]|uniref:replication protein RepA n=1 Tax=Acidisoma sp. S159 TaxID=1747225 RepID=UPI00131B41F5|nr:replication protein RepA [Acidisoma sp. S159]
MESGTQLTFVGLDERIRQIEAESPNLSVRNRFVKRAEIGHGLLTSMPAADDLSFLHSGLCQVCLPHTRPANNQTFWRRESGRFTLLITPGILDDGKAKGRQLTDAENAAAYVGVPFGPKARLIMIHLQTEGLKSRTVSLGASLSAFLRSLGLSVSGGPRGSIMAVKEQCLRIARCQYTLQWTETGESGFERTTISDTKIVEGLEILNSSNDGWSGTVELSAKFHENLREHAVPLDKRGIAILAGNSLGLDLYALFAYRLPRLKADLHLRWEHLQNQLGSEARSHKLGASVRQVMPLVKSAYPNANIEITRYGLLMKPSSPAVPKTIVRGARLLEVAG